MTPYLAALTRRRIIIDRPDRVYATIMANALQYRNVSNFFRIAADPPGMIISQCVN